MLVKNEGVLDRVIRSGLGLVLLVVSFVGLQGPSKWVARLVGVVLLVTGTSGVCPGYKLVGVSTAPDSETTSEQ